MKLAELSQNATLALAQKPLFLRTGTFTIALQTRLLAQFAESFFLLYQDYEVYPKPVFADFHITLNRPLNAHFFVKPQVQFLLDGLFAFNPLPLSQTFPIFEWGLNWAIGQHCHFYLVVHAGLLEKDGCGILLPGAPGSGKSTLCAALCLNGWRLLSDELALFDLNSGLCIPIARPVSLKDQSIAIIQQHAPHAVLSKPVHDTLKGSVAYLKVPHPLNEQSVKLRAVIFPKFNAEMQGFDLQAITKARALMRVAEQTFNYHVLGRRGFELLSQVLNDCRCYDFIYDGQLNQADAVFSGIVADLNRA